MKTLVKKLLANESGATAIEYALIAGLISVIAILALTNVGKSVKKVFEDVDTALTTAVTKP